MKGKRFSLFSTFHRQRRISLCVCESSGLWRVKDPATLCSLLHLIWEEKLTPAPAKPHASGSYLRSTSQNIFSCGLMCLVASLSATDGNLEPPVYTHCGSGSWWVQDPGKGEGGRIAWATQGPPHTAVTCNYTTHSIYIYIYIHKIYTTNHQADRSGLVIWVFAVVEEK